MAGTNRDTGAADACGEDELRDIWLQLRSLVQVTNDYPLECSLGTYDFLFESRDEIERILESLAEDNPAMTGANAARARQS